MAARGDRLLAAIFDPDRLVAEYRQSMVLKPLRFNADYGIGKLRPLECDAWRPEMSSLIQAPT